MQIDSGCQCGCGEMTVTRDAPEAAGCACGCGDTGVETAAAPEPAVGCACGCGASDYSREQEVRELKNLEEAVRRRLSELGAG